MALPNNKKTSKLNELEVITPRKNILILPPIYINPNIHIYISPQKNVLPPINPHNLWSKLPEDVLKYIYDSHFNTKNRFDTMMTVVKSVRCRQLYHEELLQFVKEMFLTNTELLLYIFESCQKARTTYQMRLSWRIVYLPRVTSICSFPVFRAN